MRDRALVKNSANVKQRDYADRKDRRRLSERARLVAGQVSTPAGREFVWREIEKHGVFEVFEPSGSPESVYAFLGRRHAGIVLLQELREQHAAAFLLMWQEAIQRDTREDAEIEAVQSAADEEPKDE